MAEAWLTKDSGVICGPSRLADRIFRRVLADLDHGVEPLRIFQIVQG